MADGEMRDERRDGLTDEQADALLDMDEADEVVEHDEDATMDSGEDEDMEGPIEEIQLQNDSVAHFDSHKDSIYCIAQHPTRPEFVATGGGDEVGYLWEARAEEQETPLLPQSYESNPQQPRERRSLQPLAKLEGQDETVNAICFTLPGGDFITTATLAGMLSVYQTSSATPPTAQLVGLGKGSGRDQLAPTVSAQAVPQHRRLWSHRRLGLGLHDQRV